MPRTVAWLVFAWLLLVPGLAAAEEKALAARRLDRYGDPLPPGAVARLGTVRLVGKDGAHAVAFSHDGKLLASGSFVTPIHLWDVATGRVIRQFRGHEEKRDYLDIGNFHLAFSPDGRLLFSGSRDNAIHIWKTSTGREVRRLCGHTESVFGVACSPDGKRLASASADGSIRLWDIARGKELRRLAGHKDGALSVAFSPDGTRLVSAGFAEKKHTVRVWDVETGSELAGFRLERERPDGLGVAFSPDGKWLAAGAGAWTSRIWDVATKKEVVVLKSDERFRIPCGAFIFTPDSRRLVTGDANGNVRVWDLARGTEERCFPFTSAPVHSLALSPDGKLLAVADGSQKVHLRSLATGKDAHGRTGHARPIKLVRFSGNQKLRSVSWDPGCVWESATGKLLSEHALLPQSDSGNILAFASGSRLFVSREGGEQLGLLDLATGKFVWSRRVAEGLGCITAFTPDGNTGVFTGSDGKTDWIRVWDLLRNKEVRHLRGREVDFTSIAISSHGKLVAADHRAKQAVLVWDVATGKELHKLHLGAGCAHGLVFSPDGGLLAAVRPDNSIYLWDLNSGKELPRLVRREEEVYFNYLAFAPDGRSLASIGPDDTFCLWEVCTGRERCRFEGHRGEVMCLAWSPNGRLLASGSDDTTLLVWDVAGTAIDAGRLAELTQAQLASLWYDLAGADAARAYRSMKKLAASPRQATPFLAERLRPPPSPTRERMTELLAHLDSRQFAERQRAARELEQLGFTAEAALRKARGNRPSLEVRQRIDQLLERLDGALKWQTLRALEVLEWLGTPDVQAALRELAGGDDSSLLTRQAKATLARLQSNAGD